MAVRVRGWDANSGTFPEQAGAWQAASSVYGRGVSSDLCWPPEVGVATDSRQRVLGVKDLRPDHGGARGPHRCYACAEVDTHPNEPNTGNPTTCRPPTGETRSRVHLATNHVRSHDCFQVTSIITKLTGRSGPFGVGLSGQ